MAKVSTKKIFISKQEGEFLRVVDYSSGSKKFSTSIPQCVIDGLILDYKVITGDTEDEVIEALDKLISEYNNAKASSEKVILFSLELNGEIESELYKEGVNHNFHPEMFLLRRDDIGSFKPKCMLGMTMIWGVFNKRCYRGLYTYDWVGGMKMKKMTPSEVQGYYKEIPHSDKSEAWFTNLQKAFENMLLKVNEHLGDITAEQLKELSESNAFTLLSYNPPKEERTENG